MTYTISGYTFHVKQCPVVFPAPKFTMQKNLWRNVWNLNCAESLAEIKRRAQIVEAA
jgi:hypothetical protein